MMSKYRTYTDYMSAAHDPVKLARVARAKLKDVDYDTMVGTGLSGAIVVPALAHRLRKRWLIVRKPGDGSHSSLSVEGSLGDRWLFVDDFIATGATRKRVRAVMDRLEMTHPSTYVGSYLYVSNTFMDRLDADPSTYVGSYLYVPNTFRKEQQ